MEKEYDDSLTRTKYDEKLIEKKVLFLPWVGKNYFYGIKYEKDKFIFCDENHKGKKILALGEYNHWSTNEETCGHDGECFKGCKGLDKCSQLTRHAVCDHLNKKEDREIWMNGYTKFERSLLGKETNWDDSPIIIYRCLLAIQEWTLNIIKRLKINSFMSWKYLNLTTSLYVGIVCLDFFQSYTGLKVMS